MARKEFVECDDNSNTVKQQIEGLEKKGFIVVNQIEWIMIFEATDENVILQHRRYIDGLNKRRKLLNRELAVYTL